MICTSLKICRDSIKSMCKGKVLQSVTLSSLLMLRSSLERMKDEDSKEYHTAIWRQLLISGASKTMYLDLAGNFSFKLSLCLFCQCVQRQMELKSKDNTTANSESCKEHWAPFEFLWNYSSCLKEGKSKEPLGSFLLGQYGCPHSCLLNTEQGVALHTCRSSVC